MRRRIDGPVCRRRRHHISSGPLLQKNDREGGPAGGANQSGGVEVFRGGLKNGSVTTRAPTVCLTASTVISNSSLVPGAALPLSTVARAISCFRMGDQVVEVALPTCRRPW